MMFHLAIPDMQARELCSFVPILQKKRQRLATLEAEAVDQGCYPMEDE